MTQNAANLKIEALTGDSVARVAADASLQQIADALVKGEMGAVVVGDDDRPAGIVSERDLVHAMAAGQDPTTTTAGDIAHTDLVWCDVESSVADVAGRMMDRYIRHVLVEKDGTLAGIVSARDLLGVYATEP